MKKTLFLSCTLIMAAGTYLHAQTPAVKKAAQSVFTLTTFNKSGDIQGTTKGVFVAGGEALAMWHPFVGADSAVVIDSKGTVHEVDALLGANDIYDICRFRVKGKTASAAIAPHPVAADGRLWLVDYSIKKPSARLLPIASTETFMDSCSYYLFNDTDVSASDLGCPLVNDLGQVTGIMQRPKNGGRAYSADSRLSATFRLTGLSINDNLLRKSGIRTALPASPSDATLTLMLASKRGNSALYTAYIDEFIAAFPTLPDGYTAKAQHDMEAGRYAEAARCMETAIRNAERKDEAHSNYSRLIYQKMVYHADSTFKEWSLDKALEEAQTAYTIRPLPVYRHQEAQITYSKGDYGKAYGLFMSLAHTDMRSGELFFEAAQCRQRLNAPADSVIALLDSAVAAQQAIGNAAPYILERGHAYYRADRLRNAFVDYCAYDSLMGGRASHSFYYLKFQLENKMRLYQQALQDIAHAIVLNRNEPTYYAEMASLQLRVGQTDLALQTTDLALRLTDSYPDIHIIRGIAFGEKGEKKKCLEALAKAKELGDERADKLMEKYGVGVNK